MAQKTQVGLLQKVKIPLFGAYSNRGLDPNKDQRFVNCFPESRKVEQIDQTKVSLVKRPGVNVYKQFKSTGNKLGRGVISFNGATFAAIDDTIYKDNPFGGGGVPTAVITMTTTTGKVGMVLGNSSIIGDYLFICDGVHGWYINSSFVHTFISDPDFPTPHVPTPVFLDGYICLSKGSDIFSCDLDTPSSWNSSNFVSAESFPDAIVGLARQNNQIVAFGSTSTEFFYDAANTSGSPFNRNESAIIQTGCAANHCIYQNERYCAFIGQSDSGGRAVWFIEGFQPKRVSDEFIDRIIDSEIDLSECSGYGVRTKGHMFYIINLILANRTFVYDVDEKLWHEWSSQNTPGVHSIFAYNHATDCETGQMYVQGTNSGYVYNLDPELYGDITPTVTSILVSVRTNKYDMDTLNRKRLHSVRFFLDRDNDPVVNETLDFYFSDDDYITNVGPISVDLISSTTEGFGAPIIYQLGSFRRRAFYIEYNSNSSIRFEALELCYTEGIS